MRPAISNNPLVLADRRWYPAWVPPRQQRKFNDLLRPPHPSELTHLRATNAAGWLCMGGTVAATIAGLWLSGLDLLLWWLVGQIILAAALVQWFIVLHECGHGTLFQTTWLNAPAGQLAGLFALIPFECWKRVHNRHHKWTGWQDVDPTTALLASAPSGRLERRLVNVCWKYWIPLFSILYRLNNFWNVPRLLRLFHPRRLRRRLLLNLVAVLFVYLALAAIAGPVMLVRLLGLATVLSLITEDVLLISQHTHVPMGLSRGVSVAPHAAIEQEQFTRSLRFPDWLSRLLLHFDAHELHHMYPFVPGPRLADIPYSPANEVSCWRWIRTARAVPGEVLLFQNRTQSGYDV
jgi:acyl-lipid omega-6 desaturase (Delta-12 desaturase)